MMTMMAIIIRNSEFIFAKLGGESLQVCVFTSLEFHSAWHWESSQRGWRLNIVLSCRFFIFPLKAFLSLFFSSTSTRAGKRAPLMSLLITHLLSQLPSLCDTFIPHPTTWNLARSPTLNERGGDNKTNAILEINKLHWKLTQSSFSSRRCRLSLTFFSTVLSAQNLIDMKTSF